MSTSRFSVQLHPSPEQAARLLALQQAFAEVCNAIALVVQESRCWNRVTLHHMAYKTMRERFPQMGSQMVCNAIYSVSRTSRMVYQAKNSPFNVALLGDKPLPLLRFAHSAPVYFDRHTLSVKASLLSMYTLDGRLKFQVALGARQLAAFHGQKLLEVVLRSRTAGAFELAFVFDPPEGLANTPAPVTSPGAALQRTRIPEYVLIAPP